MGFTTPCFIHKNTKELRDKLEELGYCEIYVSAEDGIYNNLRTGTNMNGVICRYMQWYQDKITSCIDCGENEELFLAIAALRDDSDRNQWFVEDDLGNDWVNAEDTFQLLDLWQGEPDLDDPFRTESENDGYQPFPYHKATVEELIDHFK